MALDQREQLALLRGVDRLDGIQQARLVAVRARCVCERLDVFGKARAAIAGARIDEVIADARIRADAAAHLFDVGADLLGDVRDLVHEADLGRQHRVRGVLGQLGRTHVHQHDALVVAVERRIQRLQRLDRARAVGADR